MVPGEYEQTQKSEELLTERTCKRLLVAMQLGIVITHGDGHRWIYSFEVDEGFGTSINELLREKDLPIIRSKCYGSLITALDRVDGALKALGTTSLEESYKDYDFYDAWGVDD